MLPATHPFHSVCGTVDEFGVAMDMIAEFELQSDALLFLNAVEKSQEQGAQN
jgi:hypothetical protein